MYISGFLEFFKIISIIAFLFYTIVTFSKWRPRIWGVSISNSKRAHLLFVLTLLVIGLKISEDVLEGASTSIDQKILILMRSVTPNSALQYFEYITNAGSFRANITMAGAATLFLVLKKFYREALFLSLSMAMSGLIIFAVKASVQRERPQLWETKWYWGTSFPSGHTLGTACFVTTLVVSFLRLWPRTKNLTLILVIFFASLWTLSVAVSRLVLGVHWPTDVLAAACFGCIIPFFTDLFLKRFVFKNKPLEHHNSKS